MFEITPDELNRLITIEKIEITPSSRRVEYDVDDRLIAEAELGRSAAAAMEALADLHRLEEEAKLAPADDFVAHVRASIQGLTARVRLQAAAESSDRAFAKLLAARAVKGSTDDTAATNG